MIRRLLVATLLVLLPGLAAAQSGGAVQALCPGWFAGNTCNVGSSTIGLNDGGGFSLLFQRAGPSWSTSLGEWRITNNGSAGANVLAVQNSNSTGFPAIIGRNQANDETWAVATPGNSANADGGLFLGAGCLTDTVANPGRCKDLPPFSLRLDYDDLAVTVTAVGTINNSNNLLTISSVTSGGNNIAVNQLVYVDGINTGLSITPGGSGSGGTGSYNLIGVPLFSFFGSSSQTFTLRATTSQTLTTRMLMQTQKGSNVLEIMPASTGVGFCNGNIADVMTVDPINGVAVCGPGAAYQGVRVSSNWGAIVGKLDGSGCNNSTFSGSSCNFRAMVASTGNATNASVGFGWDIQTGHRAAADWVKTGSAYEWDFVSYDDSGQPVEFSIYAGAVATAGAGDIGVKSHIRGQGAAPALTSCGGGSPAIVGSDLAGEVTMGTSATGCIITFAKAYASAPVCVVSWQATPLASQSYTISTAAITLTQTSTSSNKVDYACVALTAG